MPPILLPTVRTWRDYQEWVLAESWPVAAANSATAQAQPTGSPAHAQLASYTQADAQTALAQLDGEGNLFQVCPGASLAPVSRGGATGRWRGAFAADHSHRTGQ